jgi:hypothetical protein
MHTAGTKFFGSAVVIEEDSATLELSEIATGQEVQFNAATDVSSVNESIDTDLTPNPFANGDIVRYTTALSNTAVTAVYGTFGFSANVSGNNFLGCPAFGISNSTHEYSTVVIDDYVQYSASGGTPVTGLTVGNYYYVVFANTSGIKVSATKGGAPITVTGVTPAGTHLFNRSALSNNALYYIVGTAGSTVKLSTTLNGTVINITANTTATGADTAGHYLTKTIEE